MRLILLLLLFVVTSTSPVAAGTPEGALRIQSAYENALEEWAGKLAIAAPQEQLNVWANRPVSSHHAGLMWNEIKGALDQEWALDHCAWMLERAPVYSVGREEGSEVSRAARIVEAVRTVHYRNEKVGMVCLALTSQSDPAIMKVIEKVESQNPSREVQGQASLAIAMILKGLGDDPEVMEKRISHLRSAIIKAHEVEVGDTTVSKLAMDEIFIIRNLTKGRTAPDAIGRDSSGEPFKLSMMEGKVTVLAFWHTRMREAERGLSLLRKLHEQYGQRGVDLIGVTSDSRAVLRGLRANKTIPWRNFSDEDGRIHSQFRVRDLPIVYVLDAQRKIRYIGGPGSFVDLTVEGMLAQ